MYKYIYYRDGDVPTTDEIFVVGSNLAGRHGKGAALTARNHYGAQYGVGEGRTGMSYMLPTKDYNIQTLPLEIIHMSVDIFKGYAQMHIDDMIFFVTKLGCGLAGYNNSQIAPLFKRITPNCRFHIDWKPWLE